MSHERRVTLAIVGCVNIAIIVVIAIVAMGLNRVPSFVSLADHPDAARRGTVAYVRRDGRDGWCVVVADASGAPRKDLLCNTGRFGTPRLSWNPDNRLRVDRYDYSRSSTKTTTLIDPVSGTMTDTTTEESDWRDYDLARPESTAPDGTRIRTSDTDGAVRIDLVARDGSVTTLLRATGPRDYRIRDAVWAPDGTWLLVQDSDGRLLVVPRDGSAPGVLATNLLPYGDPTGAINADAVLSPR